MPPTVEMNVTVSVKQRPDRWALFVHEFGFYAYGHSLAEANQAVEDGVSALLYSVTQHDDLPDYLNRKGVKDWRIIEDTTTTEQRSIKVPVGSAA